jgi:uncharacterized protein (DUF2267 family)
LEAGQVPVKMTREEFLGRVRREFPFEVEGGAGLLVERVAQAIRRYVTEGEWEGIRSTLPRELAEILPA